MKTTAGLEKENGATNIMKKAIFMVVLSMAALVCWADPASAQGSRKDDIVFGPSGHPIAGATVTVCQPTATGVPCTPLATIYTDATMTVPAPNPFQADGIGNYHFYAPAGRYLGAGQRAADSDGHHLSRRDSSRRRFFFRRREQHLRVWIDPRRKSDSRRERDDHRDIVFDRLQSRSFDSHDARGIGKRIGRWAAAARGRDRFRRERRWRDR